MRLRVGLCCAAFAATGCNSLFDQHAKILDGVRAVAADTAQKIGTEGFAQIQAGGQVIDPGIVVEAAVVYRASARFAGVAGQLQAGQQGKLDRGLDPELAAKLSAIWNDTKNEYPDKMGASVQALNEWRVKRDAAQPVK